MQPVQNPRDAVKVGRGPHGGLSARGRLTATVLDLAEQPSPETLGQLAELRDTLDDVLALDCRFPFHLAAFVKEKIGRSRLAVALLVEAANRVGESRRRAGRNSGLPFALRPLVHRIVHTPGEAAYAMAYQVRNFGWAMPTPLRVALTDVVGRPSEGASGPDESDPAHSRRPASRALQPVLASA
jgi:hypothetical protein